MTRAVLEHLKTSFRIAAVVALMLLSAALPAAAQCIPTDDPDCVPALPPEIQFDPEGGLYRSDGTSVQVPVTVAFTDGYGLNASSRRLRLWTGTTFVTPAMSWTANQSLTRGWASGTIQLPTAGDHELEAAITDKHGYTTTRRVTFRLEHNPITPIVSLAPHHSDYRDTRLGSFAMSYASPPYTSMGATQAVAMTYNSEQSLATGFVQVDAQADPRNAAQVTALSLRIENWTAGSDGKHALFGREYFHQRGNGSPQRLAAQWNMSGYRTGAYNFWAVVRAYVNATSYTEKRLPVRVLIINEKESRYGGGWSLAGVQRIYNHPTNGVMINEGNGVAKWFALGSCGGGACSYVRPAGDFSTVVYRDSIPGWQRTYVDGTTVTFSDAGLQTSVKDRFGIGTTYAWQNTQDAGAVPVISSITDPAGIATTFSYNASWLLQSITAAGRSISLTYNAGRRLTWVDGLGGADVEIVNTPENTLIASYTQHFDNVATGTWNIAYDALRRVSSITLPTVTVSAGHTVRPVHTMRSQQLMTVLDAAYGTTFAAAVPPRYSDTAFIESIDAGGHTTRASIDKYGNPLKIIAPDNSTTTATWSSHGLPELVTTPTTTTTYSWNHHGQMLWSKVNGSTVFEAFYDASGRLKTQGSGEQKQWFGYGAAGEVEKTWTGLETDVDRTATKYTYNALYQVERVDGPKGEKVESVYSGNAWRNPDYVRTTREDGTQVTTSFTYDSYGRVLNATDPLNKTSTYEYDGLDRTKSIVDAQGKTTTYGYTGAYLTSVTDRAGKAFGFQYNALGWLLAETFPDGKQRLYGYNSEGLLVKYTDRRLKVVSTSYDAMHRLYNLSADNALTTFRYPDHYTTTVTNVESEVTTNVASGTGLMASLTSTLGGRKYELVPSYDESNAWEYLGTDLNTYSSGGILLRTSSVRQKIDFTPADTALSADMTVTDVAGNVSTTGFDESGRQAWTSLPNGVTQYQAYTTDGQLKSTTYSPAAVNQSLGSVFSFDALNRMDVRTTATRDRMWTFAYDAADRLWRLELFRAPTPSECPIRANCNPWIWMTSVGHYYDAAGNRTDSNAAIEPNSNRYTSFNGVALEYDAEGNVIRRTTTGTGSADVRFTWDSLGRLTSVNYNGATISYGYDGLGRRVRRTANGQAQYYIYAGDDLMQEVDSSGNPLRTYTYWPGIDNPLSVRVTLGGGDATYYYATETPGHVVGLMDRTGAVVSTYRYTPFGEVESSTDSNHDVSTQPLRYMAREIDPLTGLYYVRNRWYDAKLGRFLSEDPIGLAGGMNTYAYTDNDPINYRDPSGLSRSLDIDELKDAIDGVKQGLYFAMYGGLPAIQSWYAKRTPFRAPPSNADGSERAGPRSDGVPCPYLPQGCSLDDSGILQRRLGQEVEQQRADREERSVRRAEREACRADLLLNPRTPGRIENGLRNSAWNGLLAGAAHLIVRFTWQGRAVTWTASAAGWVVGGFTESEGDRILEPIIGPCGAGLN